MQQQANPPIISASALATIRALAIKNGYWDAERDCPTEKALQALEKEAQDAARAS